MILHDDRVNRRAYVVFRVSFDVRIMLWWWWCSRCLLLSFGEFNYNIAAGFIVRKTFEARASLCSVTCTRGPQKPVYLTFFFFLCAVRMYYNTVFVLAYNTTHWEHYYENHNVINSYSPEMLFIRFLTRQKFLLKLLRAFTIFLNILVWLLIENYILKVRFLCAFVLDI